MHVLYFHQHFGTPKGGGGNRSYAMARQLVENGHTVTMVCGSKENGVTGLTCSYKKGKRKGSVDGIDVIEYDLGYSNSDGFLTRTWKFLKFALRSIKVALTYKYDLIFATTTPLTAGIPGIFAKHLRRKPFVFEVRDLWPELPKAMGVIKNPVILYFMSVLEWVSYRSADRCIGLAPGIVQGIVDRGVPKEKVVLIPNGCDLDVLGSDNEPLRPEQVDEKDFMGVFTGSHGVANGLESILDVALELKARKVERIKLVLVGTGKLKPKLVQRAQHAGLDNVIFLEPVNKKRIASIMQAADIGMQVLADLPEFYYGTSPNKFFDYIASGLPVINNYPGWLADLINQHDCGYVVPPGDSRLFAEQLIYASENRDELKQKSANARRLAEDRFDRKSLSEQWAQWVIGTL